MATRERTNGYVIRRASENVVLGEAQFGSPGLEAIEVVGPYTDVHALGPLITVHDSRIEPSKGIGHHRHRHNERIFYIMEGELDHDDELNDIQGHMETGDIGLFTEGQRGMLHSEWNNGPTTCHAFILVYPTMPVPEQTRFGVFEHEQVPVYEEARGVETRELLGRRSALKINGDVYGFTDNRLQQGASLEVKLRPGEGGLVSLQGGRATIEERLLEHGDSLLFPPEEEARHYQIEAVEDARLLRVVHGPGFGLLMEPL